MGMRFIINEPITVPVTIGVVGSNLAWGMDVGVFIRFVLSCL
jgi:hypothetical protein